MKREEDLLRKTLHCRCRLQPRYATAVQFCEEVQTIASKVPSSRGWVGGFNFRGTVDQQYFPQLALSLPCMVSCMRFARNQRWVFTLQGIGFLKTCFKDGSA